MTRRRADVVLAERGLFPSREQARAAILAGEVTIDGDSFTKPGHLVAIDCDIRVAERARFVSRGGVKLAGALESFDIDVAGLTAVDVGASTGGFTDCLLQRHASSVTAIDVGYGQLAWSLRNDPRVTVMERTNIRHVAPEDVGGPFDIAVVDVSFISLCTVVGRIVGLLSENGQLVALVKPQFEAGKGRVGKKGVVRDASIHHDVLDRVSECVADAGLVVKGVTFSPLTGPHGNIEFWIWAAFRGAPGRFDIREVVDRAHEELGG